MKNKNCRGVVPVAAVLFISSVWFMGIVWAPPTWESYYSDRAKSEWWKAQNLVEYRDRFHDPEQRERVIQRMRAHMIRAQQFEEKAEAARIEELRKKERKS